MPKSQVANRNSPGFNPSIPWQGGIWGAADEAVSKSTQNIQKNPPVKNIQCDNRCEHYFGHWNFWSVSSNYFWCKFFFLGGGMVFLFVTPLWSALLYRGPLLWVNGRDSNRGIYLTAQTNDLELSSVFSLCSTNSNHLCFSNSSL